VDLQDAGEGQADADDDEDDCLDEGVGRPAEDLADEDGGASHGGDEDFFHEVDFFVPDNVNAEENGGEQRDLDEDAGEDEGLEPDSPKRDEGAQSAADDEEPQQRVDDGGDDPGAFPCEDLELAIPEGVDAFQLAHSSASAVIEPGPQVPCVFASLRALPV